MSTMRAVVAEAPGEPDSLRLKEIPIPEPGDAEVSRVLEFSGGYSTREPDARLEIFANSLNLR